MWTFRRLIQIPSALLYCINLWIRGRFSWYEKYSKVFILLQVFEFLLIAGNIFGLRRNSNDCDSRMCSNLCLISQLQQPNPVASYQYSACSVLCTVLYCRVADWMARKECSDETRTVLYCTVMVSILYSTVIVISREKDHWMENDVWVFAKHRWIHPRFDLKALSSTTVVPSHHQHYQSIFLISQNSKANNCKNTKPN